MTSLPPLIPGEPVASMVVGPPVIPGIAVPAPGPAGVVMVPVPGAPGRDGHVVGADQLTYRHEQVNPQAQWVIEHHLSQEVSACHVVTAGEPITVPWMQTAPKTITVYFAGPCSGYAVLS